MKTAGSCLLLLAMWVMPSTPAQAETIRSFELVPSTTVAGSHPTLRASVVMDPTQPHVENALIRLPAGMFASERAPRSCVVDQLRDGRCSSRARIGSFWARLWTPAGRSDVFGSLFLVAPTGGEVARVGASITTPGVFRGLLIDAPVTFRSEQDGLDIELRDLPASLGGIPIAFERVGVTVKGKVNRKPFTYAPTACVPATTSATVATHSAAAVRQFVTSTYTPTGCDRLPFRPGLRFSAGGRRRPPVPARRPPLDLRLSLRKGDSGFRTAQLFIPPALSADNAAPPLQSMCTPEQLEASICPPGSVIGTGNATTPLLREPLYATFYLMRRPTEVLPGISIVLRGRATLRLDLRTSIAVNRIVTYTDRIPDVPHERFKIRLFGGNGGVLIVKQLLCGMTRVQGAEGVFTSYSGSRRTVYSPLKTKGCRR